MVVHPRFDDIPVIGVSPVQSCSPRLDVPSGVGGGNLRSRMNQTATLLALKQACDDWMVGLLLKTINKLDD